MPVRSAIAIIGLCFAFTAYAQPLQLVVQISPNPSPYLSDWQTRTETAYLSITNPSTSVFLVRIDGKVFRGGANGELQANTKLDQMPVLQIPTGVSLFNAADIFPEELIEFQGNVKDQTTRSGRIPAGQYTLCITLVNAENAQQPLSQQRCAGFVVQQHLPPLLLYPVNNSSLSTDQLQRSMFRWGRETPPIVASHAEFLVVERYGDQPSIQALAVNPPVFRTEIEHGLSQLQWLPDVVLQANRSYLWSVRILDDSRQPLTEPEWALPFDFTVADNVHIDSNVRDRTDTDATSNTDVSTDNRSGTDFPCKLSFVNPSFPCNGTVENYHSEGSIDVTYEVAGSFSEVFITITENPCGTFDPPYTPDNTTTTSRPEKYKTVGRITCPSRAGPATIQIPISEYIKPGGAYILTLSGECTNSSSLSTNEPATICWRYRPLIDAHNSSEYSPTTEERRTDTPKGTTSTPEIPKIPVEPIPCDSIPTVLTCSPSKATDPATPISATLELESPDTYPYPRAAPLRVNAIDFDQAIFQCEGCGGTLAEKRIIVRDDIDYDNISWTLVGKGSLNTPFTADALAKLDDEIAALLSKLKAIKDSIAATTQAREKAIDDFTTAKAKAEKELVTQKERKKEVTDSLTACKSLIDEANTKLDSIHAVIDSIAAKFSVLLDSIQGFQDSIANLDSLLSNPLTEKELALLAKVEETLKEVSNSEAELRTIQSTIASTTSTLQDQIRKTDKALADAQKHYSDQQNKAGKSTRKIAGLQESLYNTPSLKDYQQSRRDMLQGMSAFTSQFPTALHRPELQSLVETMLAAVHDALDVAKPATRAAAKTLLDSLSTSLRTLLTTSCSGIPEPIEHSNCTTAVTSYLLTIERYHDDAATCLLTGEIIKKKTELEILANKAVLASHEPSLTAAATAVVAAQTAHDNALSAYSSSIATLDDSRKSIVENLETHRTQHAESQRTYQAERDKRDSAFTADQPVRLQSRSTFSRLRDSTRREIDSLSMVITVLRKDSLNQLSIRHTLQQDSTRLELTIKDLVTDIERLLKLISKKTEEITKPFDDALASLRSDSTKTEKALEEARKKREHAAEGTKSATGEFVYYIPPPLEKILSEGAKLHFDALKDSVAKAEQQLSSALLSKETLQATLTRMLEGIANNLSECKSLDFQIDAITDSLKAIDKELADLKNQLTKEFRTEYDRLQSDIKAFASDADNADEQYVKAAATASAKAKELNAVRLVLDDARNTLLTKQVALTTAIEAYKEQKTTFDEHSNLLSDKSDALNTKRKNYRSAQRQVIRANDQTRRAIAKEDVVSEANARSAVIAANSELSSTLSEIDIDKAAITAITSGMKSDLAVMAEKDKEVSDALNEWIAAYNTMKSKKVNYDEVLAALQVATQQMESFRGEANSYTSKMNQAETHLDNLDSPDDAIDDNDDVTAKQEARDKMKEQLESLNTKSTQLLTAIRDDVKQKDILISEADELIANARTHLAAKNEELRQFIKSEFEKPQNVDTLIITVKDKVVDGWRSADKAKEFICYIRYDNNRTPIVDCPKLDPSGPSSPAKDGLCIPIVSTEVGSSVVGARPNIDKHEPRTIALLYKNGKPIWKEWPVFESSRDLAKDVVVVRGPANDIDVFVHACSPQVPSCIAPPPDKSPVVDLTSRDWSGDGTFRHLVPRSTRVLWEPAEVPKDMCKQEQRNTAEYYANEIHADAKPKAESKPPILPGVMIEVTDSLVGWPEHEDTITARIVLGNHTGLPGEQITVIPKLDEGASEDWSLHGGQSTAIVTTDAEGYVKVPFKYGKGFAKWTVKIRWVRGDTCAQDELRILSPLKLRHHRFSKNAPTIAWDNAIKVWEGEDAESVLKGMPDVTDEDNPYTKFIHDVAGFLDENSGFVNDYTMNFKPITPQFTVIPKSAKTKLFGIARSQVTEQFEKKTLTIEVFPDDSLKPVTRPPTSKKSYNPRGGKRFKIGNTDFPFYVEMDNSFDVEDVVSGAGKLKVDHPNEFMKSLVDIPVSVEAVMLDKDTTASEGTVSYSANSLTARWSAFSFTISTLRIRAGIGCGMDGSVQHSSLKEPITFSAELGGNGEFYGEISNLPSVEAGGFVLKENSSVALDFHSQLPEDAPLGPEFQGIVIRQATLEFPPEFQSKDAEIPTTLSVSNMGIENSGVSGTISVEGGPLTWSFAKFSISVQKVSLVFKENALQEGSIEGAFSLEKPFSGTLLTRLTFSDTWTAEFETKSSISIPKWKAVAAILPGTALKYDKGKGVGTFTLVAVIHSDQLGDIEINELTFASDGTFKVDGGVKKDISIKVLKGFDLTITEVTINASNNDFELAVHGCFGIPGIGLDKLSGILYVRPGPVFDVEFTGGTISIEKGPFTLQGDFEWKDNAFYSKLSIEITNVLKGIEGVIFVGTQPTTDNDTYTFWYVGLTVSTAIPLGQSGLSITSIGGGIGWNCKPPIGNERPTPENMDAIALRASVGLGNTLPPPVGNVFNSEFVMVYVPGSITLGGTAWLMNQKSNIRGDGELVLTWSPSTSVSGFVRANVSIPDNEGKVFRMRGKVDFLFTPSKFKIESEYMDAALLDVVNANAQLRITPTDGFIKGKMWYDVSKKADIGIGTVTAGISMKATGELTYVTTPSVSLTGSLHFDGNAYLSFANSLTSFDLAKATVDCNAGFSTSYNTFKMDATVYAYITVLGFGGNVEFDIGAEV